MKNNIPRTPFATRLSGDAKETELRIRSIFQWKKKRPPLLMLALVVATAIGCGGLVSCHQQETDSKEPDAVETFFNHYRSEFVPYEYQGAMTFSFQDRTLVLEDAPENVVEQLVKDNYYFETSFEFEKLYDLMGESTLQISAKNEAKNAAEGVYFTKTVLHSLDILSEQDFSPDAGYFSDEDQSERFITDWSEVVAEYALTEYTVICVDWSLEWSETALERGPQLTDGRYLWLFLLGRTVEDDRWKIYDLSWGEYSMNRGASSISDLLNVELAQAGLEHHEHISNPQLTTLLYQTIGKRSLMLVEVEGTSHVSGLDNLIMGVYDEGAQSFVGDTFDIHGDDPGYSSWWGTDGCLYVLWSNIIYYQGDSTSSGLGYFRFDGQTLEPIYDLPATARSCGVLPALPETEAILLPVSEYTDSYNFWFTRKARPVAHGFDLYAENPDWMPGQEEQWIYEGFVPFAITDRTVTDEAKELILDYIDTTWPLYRTYYLGEEPGAPQLGDQRIDGVFYSGEERTHETTGVAFRVERSSYNDWGSLYPGPFWMEDQSCIYVVLGKDAEGRFYEVRGHEIPSGDKSVNQMILEASYNLSDLEVSLWRDGYPLPAGPGSEISFFRDVYDGEPRVEMLEGWEPVYWPGAYWTRQSWDGFSALCYHVGEEPGQEDPDAYSVYAIDTTRDDLKTYRGIHVGSTREEVLEAYPELYDTHYWHDDAPDFPGEDYLWYCDNPDGWGAAILFFFEGDKVTQIRLNNMFN